MVLPLAKQIELVLLLEGPLFKKQCRVAGVRQILSRVDTKFRSQKLLSYFAKWSYYFADEYHEISRKKNKNINKQMSIWWASSGSRSKSNRTGLKRAKPG
jgi:hypothetical protein